MKEYNIEELTKNINFEMHKNYKGILLTDSEVKILKNYGFNVNNYGNIKELMYDLEEYLNDNEVEELEYILNQLAEYNYYNYTTK